MKQHICEEHPCPLQDKECADILNNGFLERSEYNYETIREEFEKLFPKGISKERGAAIVLLAYFKIALEKNENS